MKKTITLIKDKKRTKKNKSRKKKKLNSNEILEVYKI